MIEATLPGLCISTDSIPVPGLVPVYCCRDHPKLLGTLVKCIHQYSSPVVIHEHEWFTSYLENLHTETPSLRLPNTMDENFHGHFKKKIVGITRDGIALLPVVLSYHG